MEMTLVTNCSSPSLITKLIVLCCLFWPIAAASFLSPRSKSAGPIAAALVPLALSVGGMLIGLLRTLEGMAISGSGRGGAAAAAGIAEALAFLMTGACFAVIVIVVAAIRRHRPFVDRLTAVLFALLFAEVAGALFISATIASGMWQFYATLTGAGVAGVVALIAAVWTFLTGRGRVSSRPLPFGVWAIAVLCVVTGVIVWRWVLHYMAIARFGA